MSPLRAALDRNLLRPLAALDGALFEMVWHRVRRRETALATRTTRCMRTLTHLGDFGSWAVVCLALAAAGGPGERDAALLGLGAGLATAASQLLKRVCCRPRPSARGSFGALVENPDAFSFPSGHTAAAFGAATALAGAGHGLGALLLVLAVGIAVSRVYLGAHYPLDVAAGALLGCGAGAAARALLAAPHLAAAWEGGRILLAAFTS
jgi:undecaprenyl-diphosphatase